MKTPEHNLQSACVRYFRYKYPKMRRLLFAIPNGGKRFIKTATFLKEEGVIAGVPDVFLAVPKLGDPIYAGLFIEFKVGENGLTYDQAVMQKQLRDAGYRVETIYSFDSFQNLIDEYLKTN